MVDKKLIEERAAVKKRKPTYKRVQSNQYAKFREVKWRKPKGMGNKDRRNRKGHVGMLKIGYGSPVKVRGLDKNGFREVLVKNVADLSKVDVKTDIVVISAVVGGKKRIDILTEAKAKKMNVSKVKDFDAAIKALTKTKSEVRSKSTPAKKVESKKDEKVEVKSNDKKSVSKEDDLVIIEGVGPAIAKVLAKEGINSFDDLAKTSVSKLNQILSENSLGSHKPDTWPAQAKLARDGKMDELKKLQDELIGGKKSKEDDLVIIEGIGPAIAKVLVKEGIKSFADLSKTSVLKLTEILEKNSLKQHSPDTWPAQAKLARDGKMDELKKLQDELNGGRKK